MLVPGEPEIFRLSWFAWENNGTYTGSDGEFMKDVQHSLVWLKNEELPDGGKSLVFRWQGESERLDSLVARVVGISRSYATKIIRKGLVSLHPACAIKPSVKCFAPMEVTVNLPPVENLEIIPQEVPFRVLFEDPDCIVLHKPSGVVVHPAPGNWEGTLVHGLLHRYPDIGEINGQRRPGIVHRLDQGTSGLMVVARNMWAHDRLSRAFRDRRVNKEYLALALGSIPWSEYVVDLPIGRHPHQRICMAVVADGRPARTDFHVLQSYGKTTLLRCVLHTGRTHQIRVHAASLGHPLWGDSLYGPSGNREERIFLHAWKLAFEHPRTGSLMSFRDPLDPELLHILQQQS